MIFNLTKIAFVIMKNCVNETVGSFWGEMIINLVTPTVILLQQLLYVIEICSVIVTAIYCLTCAVESTENIVN